MCIISGQVNSVAKTKILVAPINKDTQVTVYSNQVSLMNNGKTIAMILPFPNPKRETGNVKMIDMTAYEDGEFFKSINKAFPIAKGVLQGARGMSFTNSLSSDSLEVLDCGSYRYSIAPTFADIQRARKDVFYMDENVNKVLAEHYSNNYGFLICILKKSGSYSPIAYTSPMEHGKMFIPTRHEHGEHANPNGRNFASWVKPEHNDDRYEYADDWDHEIYVLGTIDPTAPLAKSIPAHADISSYLKSDHELTKLIGHIGKDYFYKWRIVGREKNCDLSAISLFAVDASRCSFPISGTQYIIQPWFHCVDCGMVDKKGCCLGCASTCHKGHALIPRSAGPFYCDCRLEGKCSHSSGQQKPTEAPVNIGGKPLISTSNMCLESYPCQHSVTVTYNNGTKTNIGLKNGRYIYYLYRHMGYSHTEVPIHFRGYYAENETPVTINVPITAPITTPESPVTTLPDVVPVDGGFLINDNLPGIPTGVIIGDDYQGFGDDDFVQDDEWPMEE
uniref:UBR-type zinc finger domain protein n=1 Tax=Clandestinovirus TaxID=2831644 RepID=A0A8F8PN05_9VIRU|nr:UBR-type zinc finger domain protein [Clandestinovirus]